MDRRVIVALSVLLAGCRKYDLESRLRNQDGLISADQYAHYGKEQAEAAAIGRSLGRMTGGDTPEALAQQADSAMKYARTFPDVADIVAGPSRAPADHPLRERMAPGGQPGQRTARAAPIHPASHGLKTPIVATQIIVWPALRNAARSGGPMPTLPAPPSPELLYLLSGDEEDLLAACENLRPADVAEALNKLPVEAAARVVSALPFDLAVQLLDEPELDRRGDIFELLDERRAVPLVEACRPTSRWSSSASSRRATAPVSSTSSTPPPATRSRSCSPTRRPARPGSCRRSSWRCRRLEGRSGQAYIGEVGQAKETVYAIYVLNPDNQRLETVVSLREIMQADPDHRVGAIGDGRRPVTVAPMTDREDVARLISKYNLLALPVWTTRATCSASSRWTTSSTRSSREQTEDVQKFGGMEALDEPYMQIGSRRDDQASAAGGCARSSSARCSPRPRWGTSRTRSARRGAGAVHSAHHQLRRQLGLAGHLADHPRHGAAARCGCATGGASPLRELPAGLALGAMLGAIGVVRIVLWQDFGCTTTARTTLKVAETVALAPGGRRDCSGRWRARCCRSCCGASASTPRARRRRSSPRWWT